MTKAISEIATNIADGLSLRTSRLEIDEIRVGATSGPIQTDRRFRLRTRFAIRFGDIEDDASGRVARADTVRSAFNSPFRPFVLATTSIGQEGLDFHPYCHAVYHWNLPPNPVEMEQREGRVDRYKGHAVRKNVAMQFGLDGLRKCSLGSSDPWQTLFEIAKDSRPKNATDLVPYWIYEVEGGARIERRVPILPFSREQQLLPLLKRSLAVYRLVFGQPRQQELLGLLESRLPSGTPEILLPEWRISLAPPSLMVARAETCATPAKPPSTVIPKTLFCAHCGDAVVHMCAGEVGLPITLFVPGDELMLFYRQVGNFEAEYDRASVDDAGEDWISTAADSRVPLLSYSGGRLWKNNELSRTCEVASRRTLAGLERRLFCRTCLSGEAHTCGRSRTPNVSLVPGQRVLVAYPPAPGIDDGELEAHIISVRGHVAKLYFQYDETTRESLFFAKSPNGAWHDLDYDVPCDIVQIR